MTRPDDVPAGPSRSGAAPFLPASWIGQGVVGIIGVTAVLMLALGTGPDAVPVAVRHGVAALALLTIAGNYLLAGRRRDLPDSHGGAFTFIGIGFVLSGSALLLQSLARPAAPPLPIAALLNMLGYVVAIMGILRLPSRRLGATDRWFIVGDSATIAAGLGVMVLVLAREGVFSEENRFAVVTTIGVLIAILACLSSIALRGAPIPNVRTLRWNVGSLCVLFASVLLGLLFASGLIPERRLYDVFFYVYLAMQVIVADHYRRDAVETEREAPTDSVRWLVRAGPAAVTLVITQAAILLWCVARGADRSALLMGLGIAGSSLPVLARLQAWSLRRMARIDRQLSEREARLDAMSRMAGGVAHELNNTLTTLMNAAELVRHSPDVASREADLAELRAAADRAAFLARQTLMASGRVLPLCSRELLGPLVIKAGSAAQEDVGARWPIDLPHGAAPLHADTDPEHLHALVRLLARIVRGSQPNGGPLQIALEEAQIARVLETAAAPVAAGRVAQISVMDEPGRLAGDALPDASILFERDITNDPSLAFDLTVARGLALALGVGLQLHAAPGRGARARVHVPLAAGGSA